MRRLRLIFAIGIISMGLIGTIAYISWSGGDSYLKYYFSYPHNNFSVFLSEDGNYLAAIGALPNNMRYLSNEGFDEDLYLFSASDNNPIWIHDRISFVSISSDGSRIAAVGDNKLYLFGPVDNNPFWEYDGISFVSISSDGSRIAAVGDNKLYLFGPVDNNPFWEYDGISFVSISSNSTYLVAVGENELYLFVTLENIPIWTYTEKIQSMKIVTNPNEFAHFIYNFHGAIDVSDNGSVVAITSSRLYLFSNQENIPIWSRLFNDELLFTNQTRIFQSVISNNGLNIAATTGKNLDFFSYSSDEPIWAYQGNWEVYSRGNYPEGYKEFIFSVSISADGDRIAASSWGGASPDSWGTLYLFSKENNQLFGISPLTMANGTT